MSQIRDSSNPPSDVMVVGEALVDIVKTPEGDIEHPGGSPANVAYGLGRLNVPVSLLTAIGDDRLGTVISEHLRSAGVQLLPQSHSSINTATAVAKLTDDGAATYEFNLCWELPLAPKLLHTGSLAAFLEPGASSVRTMLHDYQGQSTITFDPNIRPSLLGSHSESVRTFEDLVPAINVVKLSNEDAAWLYPKFSAEEAVQKLLSLGASLVVLTQGSQGSLLATVSSTCSIPCVKTTIADTIGAGDSYMAALIATLINTDGTDLTQSALHRLGSIATAAASLTVSRSGANPPTQEELDAVIDRESVPA
jgi:fructokinase